VAAVFFKPPQAGMFLRDKARVYTFPPVLILQIILIIYQYSQDQIWHIIIVHMHNNAIVKKALFIYNKGKPIAGVS